MVADVVAIDGVGNQQKVGGIVHGEGPKGVCWKRQGQSQGVVIAS